MDRFPAARGSAAASMASDKFSRAFRGCQDAISLVFVFIDTYSIRKDLLHIKGLLLGRCLSMRENKHRRDKKR